jgi:hypothetical protein
LHTARAASCKLQAAASRRPKRQNHSANHPTALLARILFL